MTTDDVIDRYVAEFARAATELDAAIAQMLAATTPTTDPKIHAAHIRLARAVDARERATQATEADWAVIR